MALAALIFTVPGCGGGGGGSAPGPPAPVDRVVIKSVGAPATLYGVEFTLQLPAGVTLATDGAGALAAGVLVASGGAAGAAPVVNYRAGSVPQTVVVSLTKDTGFPVGEFLTLTPMIAAGTVLLPTDIILSGFKAYDNFNGVPAPSIAGTVAAP